MEVVEFLAPTMETLAPAFVSEEGLAPTGDEDLVIDSVAAFTASGMTEPSEPIPGFLVQKAPVSTLLSIAQSSFKAFCHIFALIIFCL